MEPEPGQLCHASSIGMECVQGIVAGMHSGQVHQLTICLRHGRADGLVVGGQTLHKTGEGALSPWNGTQNQCAAADLCVGIGLPKTGEQLLVFPEEPFWRHIKIGVVEPGIEKDVVWRDAIELCAIRRGEIRPWCPQWRWYCRRWRDWKEAFPGGHGSPASTRYLPLYVHLWRRPDPGSNGQRPRESILLKGTD